MSLTPGPAPGGSERVGGAPPESLPVPAPPPRQHRLIRICFAIFTFEVGLFLIIFPWVDTWDYNFLQDLSPQLGDIWDNLYFRGAVSGLGLANLYVACLQLIRLLRRR